MRRTHKGERWGLSERKGVVVPPAKYYFRGVKDGRKVTIQKGKRGTDGSHSIGDTLNFERTSGLQKTWAIRRLWSALAEP